MITKLASPFLNSDFESGVIFEVSNEAVLVEKNVFSKISGGVLFYAQESTVLNDIIIRDNRFEEIGRNTGNGNNGNGIQISCGTLLGNTNHYVLSELVIYNNSFIAAVNNAPFYGIELRGQLLPPISRSKKIPLKVLQRPAWWLILPG